MHEHKRVSARPLYADELCAEFCLEIGRGGILLALGEVKDSCTAPFIRLDLSSICTFQSIL